MLLSIIFEFDVFLKYLTCPLDMILIRPLQIFEFDDFLKYLTCPTWYAIEKAIVNLLAFKLYLIWWPNQNKSDVFFSL